MSGTVVYCRMIGGSKLPKHVVLYSRATCPYCREAKELLNLYEVSYEEVDVWNADGQARLKALGCKSVPVLVVDGKMIVTGFNPEEIRRALGRSIVLPQLRGNPRISPHNKRG